MSRIENVRLIETWYHRMWNQWDKSVFEEILSPDITLRGSLGQEKRCYGGISDYMNFVHDAFPAIMNSIEEIISEEGKAFARLTYTVRHEGAILRFEPTQKEM